MSAERTCSQCGAPLPANALGSRCPKCLLALALGDSGGAPKKNAALPESGAVVEQTGMMIGRYKLLQQIGEGGFGIVFMAEQTEPVQRKVALKVIKAGMDTREIVARFEAERQALALMDHPNIAKILDAGVTEAPHPVPLPVGRGEGGRRPGEGTVQPEVLSAGRPYFVMELVKGVPITNFCDHANLGTRERLELFIKVCRAVQHAHQKGVIHRDLKPGNVLVTLHDGEPVPKVIDFGVAKALGQKLTEKTLFTRFEQMIGTPAYMSPEQAALSGLDVDTRSDIYSLGVLLYELLTGVTPLDADTLRKAALDEIRRMIQETEPPKPSTRLLTLGERLADIAKHRHAEPVSLTRLVRGDLDWITMKALEKDRHRRYETVNGLTRDIERHLNHEPVVARPPSAAYRFQRAVQRHRIAFTAGGAVMLALVLGVFVSAWQAIRATHAKQEAQTEAAKSQQVAQFLKDMLQGIEPSRALGRDTTMLREILDKTAERIAEDLKTQPDVEAELRITIGRVYLELGDFDKALAMHNQALALRRRLLGNEHPSVATSLHYLAQALRAQGKLAEAEAAFREALVIRRKRLGNQHPDVAQSLDGLGSLLSIKLKDDEPEALLREAIAIRRKVYGNEHGDVGISLDNLAHVLNRQGHVAEAAAMHFEALAIRKKFFGDYHPELVYSYANLSRVLENQGKLAEAETMLRDAVSLCQKLLGEQHPQLPGIRSELGRLLRAQGKTNEAELLERKQDEFSQKMVTSLEEAGKYLQRQGKLAEAETNFREALTIRRKVEGNEHPDVGKAVYDLAVFLRDRGKLPEAEAICHEQLALEKKSSGGVNPDGARLLELLAGLLFSQGKLEEAEPTCREAIALFKHLAQADPKSNSYVTELGRCQWRLADVLGATNRRDLAEQALRQSVAVFDKAARDFPNELLLRQELGYSLRILGELLAKARRLNEAEHELRAALDVYAALKADAPTNAFYHEQEEYTTMVLAGVLERAGRMEEAEGIFERMIQSVTNKAVVYWRQAFFHERMEKYDRALADFEQAIALKPDSAEYCRQLAWNYVRYPAKFRSAEKALPLALKAVELSRTNATELNTLGVVYLEMGKLPEAVSALTLAFEKNRASVAPLFWRAWAYKQQGDYEKAIADYEKAIEIQPRDPSYYQELAWGYVTWPARFQFPQKALPLALKAVELSQTNNSMMLNTLGRVQRKLGQLKEAVDAFTLALRKNPKSVFARTERAEVFVRLGEQDKAIADYQEALALNPDDAQTCNALAWTYVTGPVAVRSPEKALPLALKAVELSKNAYAELNTLGVVYYRLGRWQKAIETLEAACKADKEGGEAADFFFLAASHHRLGDAGKAKDYFAKASAWLRSHSDSLPNASLDELESFRAEAEEVLGKAKSN